MATISQLELPDDTFRRLSARARAAGRSVEEELRLTLTEALSPDDAAEEMLLDECRRGREALPHPFTTEAEINEFKRRGRV